MLLFLIAFKFTSKAEPPIAMSIFHKVDMARDINDAIQSCGFIREAWSRGQSRSQPQITAALSSQSKPMQAAFLFLGFCAKLPCNKLMLSAFMVEIRLLPWTFTDVSAMDAE